MARKILRGVLLVVACFTLLAQSGARAQQIPGAPAGVVSLSWWNSSGTNVSNYNDAGFKYPAQSSYDVGQFPQGNYFALTDAGTIYTGAISPGPNSQVSIVVTPTAGATGTLQPQISNDNLIWNNVGTALTMDGGVGPYSFGGVGSQSVISPQPAALIRIQDLSSAGTATISATAATR